MFAGGVWVIVTGVWTCGTLAVYLIVVAAMDWSRGLAVSTSYLGYLGQL